MEVAAAEDLAVAGDYGAAEVQLVHDQSLASPEIHNNIFISRQIKKQPVGNSRIIEIE